MYGIDWKRDLFCSGGAMIAHQGMIVLTERSSKLVMLEPENGMKVWEQNVSGVYGWLTANENRIYYLDEIRLLLIVDFATGEIIDRLKFQFSYLGYLFVRNNFLITGAWRGYTDLMCYELDNELNLRWKSERSGNLISYSLPILYDDLIILANNSNGILYGIDIQTGKELWAKPLPSNVGQLDRDFTIQLIDESLFVYTNNGEIHRFDLEVLRWEIVLRHTTGIRTIKPMVLETQYIFQDTDGYICSCDKGTNKLRWKFYSNHTTGEIQVVELKEGTLLGGNMNKLKLIDNQGEIIQNFGGIRRYDSKFYLINDDVFYIAKGSIVAMKRNK